MGFFSRKKSNDIERASLISDKDEGTAAYAVKGSPEGLYRMGLACEDTDPEKAKGYYEESYEKDYWPAGFRIARMEIVGDGGDMETAISILSSAFETCDDSVFEGSLDTMYDIGMKMFYAKDVADNAIARDLLYRSADLGHGPSLEFLKKVGLRK